MASFFDSSRVDEEKSGESSRPRGGGEDFFSFNDAPLFKNKEEPVGGLFFGDGSSKEENQQGFFRTPSKKDGNSLDFAFLKPEEGLGDTEPTFLAPFSRTPPSKRQNQGPSPTPASQAPHTGDESAKKESNSDVPSLQRLGDQDPRTFDPSNIPSSGRASSFAHRSSPLGLDQGFEGTNSFSTTDNNFISSTASKASPKREEEASFQGAQGGHRQREVVSGTANLESTRLSKEGVPSNNIGRSEKVESMTMASGRMDSTGVRNSSAQPIGQEFGVSHPALGQNLGPMQQLLGRHMQHLAELLAAELENTKNKEERMVKELEQVEQEGKAYNLQLKRNKEQYSSRLSQISGFLGLNANQRRNT